MLRQLKGIKKAVWGVLEDRDKALISYVDLIDGAFNDPDSGDKEPPMDTSNYEDTSPEKRCMRKHKWQVSWEPKSETLENINDADKLFGSPRTTDQLTNQDNEPKACEGGTGWGPLWWFPRVIETHEDIGGWGPNRWFKHMQKTVTLGASPSLWENK